MTICKQHGLIAVYFVRRLTRLLQLGKNSRPRRQLVAHRERVGWVARFFGSRP